STVRELEAEVAAWRPDMLIVRVDRTDPSKNVIRGFLAFERLLEDNPEYRGRVTLWAFLQPSRQDVDAYRQYLDLVESTVARINPCDVEITARALHRALQMSSVEREQRSQAIKQIVATNDVARWIRHQLEDIRSVTPPIRALSGPSDAQPTGFNAATKDKRRGNAPAWLRRALGVAEQPR